MSNDFQSFKLPSTRTKPKTGGIFGEDEEDIPMAQELHKPSIESLIEAGNTAAEQEDWGSALSHWNQALDQQPAKQVAAKLHEQRAQVFLQLDRNWEALQAATLATEEAPTWGPGFLTRGRAQLNYGEPELAMESLEMVLKLEQGGESAAAAEADLAAARVLVLQRRQRGQGGSGERVNTDDR